MDNYNIDSLIERYKKEIVELNKMRNVNLKEEKPQIKKKENLQNDYTKDQKGAGDNSEADDKISPLEREINPKDGYRLEDLNVDGEIQNRKRFTPSDKNKTKGDMTKKNTDSAKLKYQSFIKDLNEFGTLRVETVSSNSLYPVSNVHVIVYKEFMGDNFYIYDAYTDGSGVVKDLNLPAPNKSYSQNPENGGVVPYATYNLFIEHPNFINTLYENVPIFDSITSIQSVEMIPDLDGALSKPTLVIEKEPKELGGN